MFTVTKRLAAAAAAAAVLAGGALGSSAQAARVPDAFRVTAPALRMTPQEAVAKLQAAQEALARANAGVATAESLIRQAQAGISAGMAPDSPAATPIPAGDGE